MGIKQDRAYARTAQDIERKYAFGKSFAETLGVAEETRNKVEVVESGLQSGLDELSALKTETLQIVAATKKELSEDITALTTEVEKKLDADAIEHGESGGWTYRKWSNGMVECWKTFQQTVVVSNWLAWGSLFTAALVTNVALPFAFAIGKKEYATIHGGTNGFLVSTSQTMSQTTTGEYSVCSPIHYNEPYEYIIDIYVVGMVEE